MQKIVSKAFQRYWRLTRALTLGAQGLVVNEQGQILLIRHTYRPGWHFPGGGVEKGEAVEDALCRELEEEAGIQVKGRPQLYGLYCNAAAFPGDHIVLYVIRDWAQPRLPAPNAEIAEQRFCDPASLPDGVTAGTMRRIEEFLGRRAAQQTW